jgi:hypothetical protein
VYFYSQSSTPATPATPDVTPPTVTPPTVTPPTVTPPTVTPPTITTQPTVAPYSATQPLAAYSQTQAIPYTIPLQPTPIDIPPAYVPPPPPQQPAYVPPPPPQQPAYVPSPPPLITIPMAVPAIIYNSASVYIDASISSNVILSGTNKIAKILDVINKTPYTAFNNPTYAPNDIHCQGAYFVIPTKIGGPNYTIFLAVNYYGLDGTSNQYLSTHGGWGQGRIHMRIDGIGFNGPNIKDLGVPKSNINWGSIPKGPLIITIVGNNGGFNIYYNTTQMGAFTGVQSVLDTIDLGGWGEDSSRYLSAGYKEFIVFPQTLSTTDISTVYNYLSVKWNK